MAKPLCWHCQLETRHFSFNAYGASEKEATEAMCRTLKAHGRQFGLRRGWWQEFGEISTAAIYAGGFRDGQPIEAEK